jgi:cell filamentation protein, protein adenylyltransferase
VDIERFRGSPIGSLVEVTVTDGGVDYAHFAYVPNSLPRTFQLSSATQRLHDEALLALGRLDGQAGQLPEPALLARPAIREEAVSTSALEGTYSTLPKVFEAEFLEDDEMDRPLREVRNYVRAAERGLAAIREEGSGVTIWLIRGLHEILMEGLGSHPSDVGQVRNRQNWIGLRRGAPITESLFVPPPSGDILTHGLEGWEAWLHDDDIPALVRIAVGHYQFEALHPFIDGNGRIGRLVAQLQLVEGNLLRFPILNLSPYLEPRGDEYRDRLRELSASGEWEPWLLFFLTAIREQAEAASRRTAALLELREDFIDKAKKNGIRGVGVEIAAGLIGFPVTTSRFAAEAHDVTYQAANTAIARLEKAGILVEVTGKSYGRLFVAPRVLDLISPNGATA